MTTRETKSDVFWGNVKKLEKSKPCCFLWFLTASMALSSLSWKAFLAPDLWVSLSLIAITAAISNWSFSLIAKSFIHLVAIDSFSLDECLHKYGLSLNTSSFNRTFPFFEWAFPRPPTSKRSRPPTSKRSKWYFEQHVKWDEIQLSLQAPKSALTVIRPIFRSSKVGFPIPTFQIK